MANEKRLELIDRKELVKTMCRACNNECCEDPCEPGECFMYDAINNAPTVDAVPVVHGRWKDGECTVCGFDIRDMIDGESEFRNWVWEGLDYCPNCGADMRERS